MTRPYALGGASDQYSGFAMAFLVVSIIAMLVLPMPAWLLDVMVALNISMGVLLLLVSLFVRSPLGMSSLPSMLLISTLFRISVNVATTRQLLLHAHAGDIINTFGKLVIGGSLVVGLVVFLIITIVQFIVVAKGAERVAEVVARFTLDALPGKQMSIDADVRAGSSTQAEAAIRRAELTSEAQFYGAMDGAMKFIKGDAIAGIVIVMVNLFGGIAIGVLVMDLPFAAAVQKFSVLSIGDGLVSQIPSLFVAIAAGIVITRTASNVPGNLGNQISQQFAGQPNAILMAAVVMGLFALVPGLPFFVFMFLAAGLGTWGYSALTRQRAVTENLVRIQIPSATRDGEKSPVLLLPTRPNDQPASSFRLELSQSLVTSVGVEALNSALLKERTRLKERFGLPFPGLALLLLQSPAQKFFSVYVQDLAEATLHVPDNAMVILGRDSTGSMKSVQIADAPALPIWLGPSAWADETMLRGIEIPTGVEVLSIAEVIARCVVLTMQRNPAAAFGVQEVQIMMNEIRARYPDLSREALAILPIGRLAELLRALARERVPIADLPGVLQALVTHGFGETDISKVYEAVRLAMARGMAASLLNPGEHTLAAAVLDPAFEKSMRNLLEQTPEGPVLALQADASEAAKRSLISAIQSDSGRNLRLLALPTDLRRAMSRLFRSAIPDIVFMSNDELSASGVGVDYVVTVQLSG